MKEAEGCCDVFDLLHAYQKRGEIRRFSDRNIGAVLFSPVRFLAMNRCDPCAGEEELSELIRMMQSLLLY